MTIAESIEFHMHELRDRQAESGDWLIIAETKLHVLWLLCGLSLVLKYFLPGLNLLSTSSHTITLAIHL